MSDPNPYESPSYGPEEELDVPLKNCWYPDEVLPIAVVAVLVLIRECLRW